MEIKGHKSKAKIERGLQANTFYSYQGEVAVDQDFDPDKLTKNGFFFPAFGVLWRQRQQNHQELKNLVNAIIKGLKISNGIIMAEYIWVEIKNFIKFGLRQQ